MIEPQNTMIPRAAESRPGDLPKGDAAGFGEMFSQSLGPAAPVDPNAVQQIATGNQRHHQPAGGGLSDLIGDDAAAEPAAGSPAGGDVSTPHLPPVPLGVAILPPVVTVPFVAADPIHATAGVGDPIPTVEDTTTSNLGPVLSLATTSLPAVAPETTEPGDGNRQPMRGDDPNVTPLSPAPADGVMPTPDTPIPVNSVAIPVVASDPAAKAPLGPEAGVRVNLPPIAAIDPGHSVPVQSAPTPPVTPGIQPPPAPQQPAPDRSLPVTPAPRDASNLRRVTSPQSMVELIRDTPIRVDSSRQAATVPTSPTTNEPAAPIAGGDGNVQTPVLSPPSIEAGAPTTTFAQSAADIVRPQASALAERVMHVIDLQRTQPPPRSMIVDIPEIEGMRLMVSVQSGGQVHVAPAAGSGHQDTLTPFMDDLSRVLAERGFEMTGDERRRGYNPNTDDEPASLRSRPATRRRPVRRDDDLRI